MHNGQIDRLLAPLQFGHSGHNVFPDVDPNRRWLPIHWIALAEQELCRSTDRRNGPTIRRRRKSAMSEIVASGWALVFEMADDGHGEGAASHRACDFWVHTTLLLGQIDSLVDKPWGMPARSDFFNGGGTLFHAKNARTRMRAMNIQIKLKPDRPRMTIRDQMCHELTACPAFER
jgi:hypothetical protein